MKDEQFLTFNELLFFSKLTFNELHKERRNYFFLLKRCYLESGDGSKVVKHKVPHKEAWELVRLKLHLFSLEFNKITNRKPMVYYTRS